MLALSLAAAIAAIVQFGLGASPVVVALIVVTGALGLSAFALLGPFNAGAWVALFYVLGNTLIALYAKTLFGQTVGSHLFDPVDSFAVLAATTAALVTALLIARRTGVGGPLLKRTTNTRTLAWVSWGSFLIGTGFWFLNQYYLGPNGSGFGGFVLLNDLLLMGVIGRTALLLERSSQQRSFDATLAMVIGVGILLGLLSDTKTNAAYPVVSYFATILFYRRGLARRQVVLLLVTSVCFVTIVAPLVHIWRGQGVRQLRLSARAQLVAHSLADVARGGRQLTIYQAMLASKFDGGYYNYFGGNGRGQMLLGRYASVQQIDPVVAQVNVQGTMGIAAVAPALARQLPSFMYPNKPQVSEAYVILVHYGLVDPAGGKYPTLPLAGQAYAGFGFPGAIAMSFVVFLCVFLALKKFGWDLYRNVFAIFIFSEFIVVYASQGDLVQYAGLVLRVLPEFLLVFWLLQAFSRLRMRRRTPTGIAVLAAERGYEDGW